MSATVPDVTLFIRVGDDRVTLSAVVDGHVVLEESHAYGPRAAELARLERASDGGYLPALIGKESDGVHTTAYNFVMKNEVRLQQQLFGHVVLASELRDLRAEGETLRDALAALTSPGTPVHVTVVH